MPNKNIKMSSWELYDMRHFSWFVLQRLNLPEYYLSFIFYGFLKSENAMENQKKNQGNNIYIYIQQENCHTFVCTFVVYIPFFFRNEVLGLKSGPSWCKSCSKEEKKEGKNLLVKTF